MRINWRRGLWRAWAVFAVLWTSFFGWSEYNAHSWSFGPTFHTTGECWDRLAKWPNGTVMKDNWDGIGLDEYAPDPDTPPLIYRNGRAETDTARGDMGTGIATPFERNQWRNTVRQRLIDCEAAALPTMKHLATRASDYWSNMKDSLPLILLPPFGLLIMGYVLSWIIRGFSNPIRGH